MKKNNKLRDVLRQTGYKYRYLRTTITNQNLIQEEIKRRLNSGNACYHSVQNFSFSRLLSKNVKIRIYSTIILRVVLYECEILSVTLKVECIVVFGSGSVNIWTEER
jgi:hypothetical protein